MPFSRPGFSGYPFDRDSDRDNRLQSKLDDIAKRHPEFAEHLDKFTERPNQRSHRLADDQDFGARFGRSFGDRFGFPFDRDDIDSEIFRDPFQPPNQDYYQPRTSPPQNNSQHPSTSPQQSKDHQVPTHAPSTSERPSEIPEKNKNHIQQSSTIDLGQKQDPVANRSPRSMSAPPADKVERGTPGKNISANQPPGNMSHSEAKPTERIIPIQIEGRDTPIVPKNVSSAQPNQSFRGTERIFGQRPEQFTQFLNREPRQFQDSWHDFVEDPIMRKQSVPQQNVPHHQPQKRHSKTFVQDDEVPIPVQRDTSESTDNVPIDQPKPACQEQKSLTAIDQIQIIQKDVSSLMEQVQKFAGKPRDKQYLYLDEMLTRNLIKLDNIDVQGQDNIRSSRKEAIKCIEKAIGMLEAKAALNEEENKTQEGTAESDVKEGQVTQAEEIICEKMEVVPEAEQGKSTDEHQEREKSSKSKEDTSTVQANDPIVETTENKDSGEKMEVKKIEKQENENITSSNAENDDKKEKNEENSQN